MEFKAYHTVLSSFHYFKRFIPHLTNEILYFKSVSILIGCQVCPVIGQANTQKGKQMYMISTEGKRCSLSAELKTIN